MLSLPNEWEGKYTKTLGIYINALNEIQEFEDKQSVGGRLPSFCDF